MDDKNKSCITDKEKQSGAVNPETGEQECCEDNCEFCILDDPNYKGKRNIPPAPPAPDLPDF